MKLAVNLYLRKLSLILVATTSLIGACSAIKLGYNNAAAFAYTYLSSKVDFNEQQSAVVKAKLANMVGWHRTNELPALGRELEYARAVLYPNNANPEPIQFEQVQALNKSIRDSLRRTANAAAPEIAGAMLTLHTGQLEDIRRAIQKSNEDYRKERLMPDENKRLGEARKRMEDRFERWLGRLNTEQKNLVSQWAKAEGIHAEQRYQARLERQQRFIALATQASGGKIDEKTLARQLADLLNDWQTPDTSTEVKTANNRQDATVQLIVDVVNAATLDQRKRAAERAATWAEDFSILASSQ